MAILVAVIVDENSVILMEQPEDGIHAGLLGKLVPLLRANMNGGQFFMASHSATVLNRVKPEEVRLVEMREGETRVRSLAAKEVRSAQAYMMDDGSFSEFLESFEEED